jgi:hypothetical protein
MRASPAACRGADGLSHPLEYYSAYLDGHCLSDAEVEALRSWIKVDTRHAAEFVDFAMTHAAITDRLKLGQLLEDLASRKYGDVITPDMLADAIRGIEINSPRVAAPLPPLPEPEPPGTPLWHVMASIAAGIAIVTFAGWILSQSADVNLPIAAAPPKAPAIAQVPALPKVVARLATSFDAKWAEGARVAPGEDLREGARLNLLEGAIHLQMAGGSSVVVEGPSDLKLTDSNALHLAQGKAAVRIDAEAESFVLLTKTLKVVDLGTEFGVEAAASGEDHVMVFDGSVELADRIAESSPPSEEPRRLHQLAAGFEVGVDAKGVADLASAPPKPLSNPRYFLRPDEIEVRLRALAGSTYDRKLASHYQRQRIEGLIAYQGFDAASAGRELTFGVASDGIQALGAMQFIENAEDPSGGVDISNGPAFIRLDTSATGRFAHSQLVNERGRIGRPGTEIWLTWKSQQIREDKQQAGSAGLSLMFGDQSDMDEPVFFGRAFGAEENFVAETAWGNSPPPHGERMTATIDADPTAADVQGLAVDDRLHTWVARVEFRHGPDRVSVWMDPDLSALDVSAPHGVLTPMEVEFDRIRIAVNRGEEVWRFKELAVALHPQAFLQLTHLSEFTSDQ